MRTNASSPFVSPRAGEIGSPLKHIEIEPLPLTEPIPEPSPEVAPAEPVPAP